MDPITRRRLLIGAVFLAAGAIGAGAGIGLATRRGAGAGSADGAVPGLLWPPPKQLSATGLTDHHGRALGVDRLRGKWSFLFFGFTHCPDVCPATLAVLAEVADRLGEPAHYQYLFVSVDPQRDTAERLAQYVAYFDPRILGARAEEPALAQFTRALGIVYLYPEGTSGEAYPVDHSATVMLLDPQARLVGTFPAPHRVEEIAERAARIRDFVERRS